MRLCMVTGWLPASATMVAAAAAVTWAAGSEAVALGAPAQRPAGFGAALNVDRAVYRADEPITVTLQVFNHSPEPVRLHFPTGQRFDVVIEDQSGLEVWRWSAGRMFTMALGEEAVGPDSPWLTYEAQHGDGLKPGRYTIRGFTTDTGRHASATITVTVR